VLTGLISIAYFLAFWKLYRDPADDPELTDAEKLHIAGGDANAIAVDPAAPKSSLGYLIRQRKVFGLAIGFGSYNYVFYLLLTWLPSYLSYALHVDLLHSFLYTGVPWLCATVADLIGGATADALIKRGWDASRVRKTIIVFGMVCGLGILGAANAHTVTEALLWISLSISGLSAAAPVGWSVPSLIAPRGSTGTVGGIMNFSNQISGISAPIITGYAVSVTHSYFWAFAIASIYLLFGIASYVFLLGRIEQVPAEPGLAA
jgi:MFS family permease